MNFLRIPKTDTRYSLAKCIWALWPAYVLALGLILCGFQWSLPDGRQIDKSFHVDEIAAVWAVNQIHPPGMNPHWFIWGTALFYQVYGLKVLASGAGLFPLDDRSVLLLGRVAVLLSALGAITCVYLLGRRLFDDSTGRMAALLLAVMPGFAINSHYFKMDVPMTFWILASLLTGYVLADNPTPRHVCLLGLLAGFAVATKYSAAPVLGAGLTFLLLRGPAVRWPRYWLLYGVCAVAGFLLGEPRILPDPGPFLRDVKIVAQLGKSGLPWAVSRPPAWLDYLTGISQDAMTLPLWLAAGAGLILALTTRFKQLLPLWVFLTCYVFLLNQDNWRLMRYATPLLPFAALFVALLWKHVRGWGTPGRAASYLIYPLLAYAFLFSLSYVRVMRLIDPRIQAGNWIAGHLPRGVPVPVSFGYYFGGPQLQLWDFEKQDIGMDADALHAASSPYLVLSEFATQRYGDGVDRFPDAKRFFQSVQDDYVEIAHFENSQKLLGVDSKQGALVTHDWLYPNPRITIYRRVPSP